MNIIWRQAFKFSILSLFAVSLIQKLSQGDLLYARYGAVSNFKTTIMIVQKKQFNLKTILVTLGLFLGTMALDTLVSNSHVSEFKQARFLGCGTVDLWTSEDGECTEYKTTVFWIKIHQGNTCD